MASNYLSTIHKPTSVSDAVCGHFFHKTHKDLIVAKGNLLDFYNVKRDAKTGQVVLTPETDFQVHGGVACLRLIELNTTSSNSKPLLFFLTNKQHASFVEPAFNSAVPPPFRSDRQHGALETAGASVGSSLYSAHRPSTNKRSGTAPEMNSKMKATRNLRLYYKLQEARSMFVRRNRLCLRRARSSEGILTIETNGSNSKSECDQTSLRVCRCPNPMLPRAGFNAQSKASASSAKRYAMNQRPWKVGTKPLLSMVDKETLTMQLVAGSGTAEQWLKKGYFTDLTYLEKVFDELGRLGGSTSTARIEEKHVQAAPVALTQSFPCAVMLGNKNSIGILYKIQADFDTTFINFATSELHDVYPVTPLIAQWICTHNPSLVGCLSSGGSQTGSQVQFALYIVSGLLSNRTTMDRHTITTLQLCSSDAGCPDITVDDVKEDMSSTKTQCPLLRIRSSNGNGGEGQPGNLIAFCTDAQKKMESSRATSLPLEPFRNESGTESRDKEIAEKMEVVVIDDDTCLENQEQHIVQEEVQIEDAKKRGSIGRLFCIAPKSRICVREGEINDIANDLHRVRHIMCVMSRRNDHRIFARLTSASTESETALHDWHQESAETKRCPHCALKVVNDKPITYRQRAIRGRRASSEGLTNRRMTKMTMEDQIDISKKPKTFKTCLEVASALTTTGNKKRLKTRAHGLIRDRTHKLTENGVLCIVSQDHSVIALRLTDGGIKFIAVKATLDNADGSIEHFSARVEQDTILDMQFLHDPDDPSPRLRTVCILYRDGVTGESSVFIYSLSLRDKDLRENPRYKFASSRNRYLECRKRTNTSSRCLRTRAMLIDRHSKIIMPTLKGGWMFVAFESICYYPTVCWEQKRWSSSPGSDTSFDQTQLGIPFANMQSITAWCRMESNPLQLVYLLADSSGNMLVLWSQKDGDQNTDPSAKPGKDKSKQIFSQGSAFYQETKPSMSKRLKIDYLGKVAAPVVLIPLTPDFVYVGSRFGDSQLVRLVPNTMVHPNNSICPYQRLNIIDSFLNIGPISDMCLVPTTSKQKSFPRFGTANQFRSKLSSRHKTYAGMKSHMNPCSQQTLVTCSGTERDGSLCLLREGIGIDIICSMKVPSTQTAHSLDVLGTGLLLICYPSNSWVAKVGCDDEFLLAKASGMYQGSSTAYHSSLSLTSPNNHPISALPFAQVSGFNLEVRTICVHQIDDLVFQITAVDVRTLSRSAGMSRAVNVWKPMFPGISAAACSMNVLLVVCAGVYLMRLAYDGEGRVQDKCQRTFNGSEPGGGHISSVVIGDYGWPDVAAVAMWFENKIHLIDIDDLQSIRSIETCSAIPRSMSLITFSNRVHLAFGTGAGEFCYCDLFSMITNETNDGKWASLQLGDQPLWLATLSNMAGCLQLSVDDCDSMKNPNVLFITGEASAVMYCSNEGTVRFANVNCEGIKYVSSFQCSRSQEASPARLIIVRGETSFGSDHNRTPLTSKTDTEIVFGEFDAKNKIQVKKISLLETACHIVYHQDSDTMAVLVYHPLPSKADTGSPTAVAPYDNPRNCASYRAERSVQFNDPNLGKPFNPYYDVVSGSPGRASKRKCRVNTEEESTTSSMNDLKEGTPSNVDDGLDIPKRKAKSFETQSTVPHVDFPDCDDSIKNTSNDEYALILVDRRDYKLRCSFFLKPKEHGTALTICQVPCDPCDEDGPSVSYIVVGTGLVEVGEFEPKSGRLLIFKVNADNKPSPLLLVAEAEVKGGVYALCSIQGHIAASIGCDILLFSLEIPNGEITPQVSGGRAYEQSTAKLVLVGQKTAGTIILYLKSQGDMLLTGDLVRSMSMYKLQKRLGTTTHGSAPPNFEGSPNEATLTSVSSSDVDPLDVQDELLDRRYILVEAGVDNTPNWMSAIAFLKDDVFAGVDTQSNIFITSLDDDVEKVMRTMGMLHIGEFINVIIAGTLGSQRSMIDPIDQLKDTGSQREIESSRQPMISVLDDIRYLDIRDQIAHASHMLGSVSGYIGHISGISRRLYLLMWEIQKRMQCSMNSVGSIDHAEWRAFESDFRVEASSGFIDGDMIEQLFTVSRKKAFSLLRGMMVGNDIITKEEDVESVLRLIKRISSLCR